MLFGRLVHPLERFDSIGQRLLQIVHELERARLCLRWKIKTDVQFAECFTDVVILRQDHSFPTWLDLLCAAQDPLSEIEIFVHEILRKGRRGRIDQMPAQVRLPIVQRCRSKQVVGSFEKLRLLHVDIARLDQVNRLEVIAPVPVWRHVLQLSHIHLVVVFDRVA